MQSIRDLSVRKKLYLIVLLTCSVATLLAFVLYILYEIRTSRSDMVVNLSTQAEMSGSQCISALLFDDADTASETLGKLRPEKSIIAARVYNEKGEVFASYLREDPIQVDTPPMPPPDEAFSQFGDGYLQVFQPIFSDDQRIGTIELLSDLAKLRQRVRNQMFASIGALIGALLLAFVFAARLLPMISRPVLHLSETAKRISNEKDYALRAIKEGDDELGQLIDMFNDMLQQIQERDSALLQAHDELEDRVQERTQELDDSEKRYRVLTNNV
ncbi:MAG: CHASE sensor domain-containing protein, partial [bacterium]